MSDNIGVSANATHNITLGDKLDNIAQGKRDDQYFNFSLGLNWYFDNPIKMKKDERQLKKQKDKELQELRKRNKRIRKEGVPSN